jgi:hypothetical protein
MTWNYVEHHPRQQLAVLPFLFESGNIAYSLATGGGFASPFHTPTGPTAWMTPVYPFLLSLMMRWFGIYTFQSYLAAVALNIAFSTLACVPIFYVGKRVGGAATGALAAWLWAVFPNANLQTFETLWDASLDALLGAAILWATLALEEKPRGMKAWCAYGLLWGFTLMTNPALAALLPFLLGWAAYRHWKRGLAWAKRAAACIGVMILCCVPWTARNYEVFHAWVPLRSVMGLQLWLGNNPGATPLWLGQQHPIFNSTEREKYEEMGEIAYMREKKDLALEYAAEHPGRVAELSWRRFLTVWSGGTAYPARDFLASRSVWFRYVLLFNVAASIGALAGIVILWRRRSAFALPLAVAPIVYPLPYYVTLVEPRYRLPIDPMVLLLFAFAISALITKGHPEVEDPSAPSPGREPAGWG